MSSQNDNSDPQKTQSPKLTPKQREILRKLATSVIICWGSHDNLLFPAKNAWKALYLYRKADNLGKVNNIVFTSLLDKKLIERKRSGQTNRGVGVAHYELTDLGRLALAPASNEPTPVVEPSVAPNTKPLSKVQSKVQEALLKLMADGRYLYRQELAGIPNDLWVDVTEKGKMYGDHFVVRPLINAGYLYEERADEEGSPWVWKCTIGDEPKPTPEPPAASKSLDKCDTLGCFETATVTDAKGNRYCEQHAPKVEPPIATVTAPVKLTPLREDILRLCATEDPHGFVGVPAWAHKHFKPASKQALNWLIQHDLVTINLYHANVAIATDAGRAALEAAKGGQ